MSKWEEGVLFDDETGCLTDYALASLMDGSLEELQRLEAAEHLSFCDACVERYTALLTEESLLPAPELMKQSILQTLRKRAAKVMVNRYFHMGVAACLTLILWGAGVFGNMAGAEPAYKQQPEEPRKPVSSYLEDVTSGVAGGLNQFMDQFSTIDLRGAFSDEKK